MPENPPKRQVNRSVVFGSMRDATLKVIFGLMDRQDYQKKFQKVAKRAMMTVKPGRSYSSRHSALINDFF